MSHRHVVEITDANFQDTALASPVPVLIDFWAAWCPPCRAMAPHIDALADAYQGRVRVGTCDADRNQVVAAGLEVRSLPTFVVLKGGRVVGQIVGAVPPGKLDELVRKSLG